MDREIALLQTIKSVLKLKLDREPNEQEIQNAIHEIENYDASKVRDHIEPWNEELDCQEVK